MTRLKDQVAEKQAPEEMKSLDAEMRSAPRSSVQTPPMHSAIAERHVVVVMSRSALNALDSWPRVGEKRRYGVGSALKTRQARRKNLEVDSLDFFPL
jgi:hypothetical protein